MLPLRASKILQYSTWIVNSYLTANTQGTDRYTTWFGEYSADRHDTVLSHFQKLHEGDFGSFTYNCECTEEGVFAYVNPDECVFPSCCV